jgi:hypothetical protein
VRAGQRVTRGRDRGTPSPTDRHRNGGTEAGRTGAGKNLAKAGAWFHTRAWEGTKEGCGCLP